MAEEKKDDKKTKAFYDWATTGIPVITSRLAYREWYVARTNQIAALGYVSRTNHSVVFVLRFERCSNFNEVMGIRREVRKMESSFFRKRNVGFSVFLTCILPRFMRNAILLNS